jgi:hypothetical protein
MGGGVEGGAAPMREDYKNTVSGRRVSPRDTHQKHRACESQGRATNCANLENQMNGIGDLNISNRVSMSGRCDIICDTRDTQLNLFVRLFVPSLAMIRNFCKRFSTLLPNSQSPITPRPHFFNAVSADGKLPTYRVIDGVGNVIEGAELPEVSSSLLGPAFS